MAKRQSSREAGLRGPTAGPTPERIPDGLMPPAHTGSATSTSDVADVPPRYGSSRGAEPVPASAVEPARADAAAATPRAAPPDDAGLASDAEIMEAARSGARRALQLCAEAHGESIGRVCLALLGSQAEADAVTEEVLLEAYRRSRELLEQRSLRGWLLGLARNACSRRLERRRTRRRNDAEDAAPSSVLGASARARQARAALGRVRPSEREALVLRFAADATGADVAIACNIEPAEAQRRLSRALLSLRHVLESEATDD